MAAESGSDAVVTDEVMFDVDASDVAVVERVACGERVPHVPGFARRDGAGLGKREGKALRERMSRHAHARFEPDCQRPDAVTAVRESNTGRLAELVPIRVGRMVASPFAFLRGTAGLMAHDLACGPVTGIGPQVCGDAHAANFGLYGDARGRLVMDLNDFNETVYGPWEWDLKRLAASLVLAGREAGAGEEVCRVAARDAAGAYRRTNAVARQTADRRGVEPP